MTAIILAGVGVFLLASAYFFARRAHFGSELPWLVSFITVLSYLVLFGLNAAATEPILWTRWIGYGLSCTLLTASLLAVFEVRGSDYLSALLMTPLIMLTGFLASYFSSDLILAGAIFALGCLPFVRLIQILYAHHSPATKPIMNYLYFGWMGFPVVFIFSSEYLDLLPSVALALGLYLALDILTKIIFYHSLETAKRKSEG